MLDYPRPKDVADIRSFRGMINQFSRFSPKVAELSTPLRQLLQKTAPWVWDKSQQDAFGSLKDGFRNPPVLATYDVQRTTIVSADASNHGIGAVLTQIQQDGWDTASHCSSE